MANRSRKRRGRRARRPPADAAAAPEPAVREASRRRRAARDEAPPAPWGSFPLVELVTLLAIVALVAGFFVGGERGIALIGFGLVAGSAAGLELSIREHLAGYRSHTMILAGGIAVAVLAGSFVLVPDSTPVLVPLVLAAAAFGLAAWRLTASFRRRSGGFAFKVGPRGAGRR